MSDLAETLDEFFARRKSAVEEALSEDNLVRFREAMEQTFFLADECMSVVTSAIPTRVGEIDAEWLCAENCQTQRRLLYLHGGGWSACSINSHRALASRIAVAAECAVLTINYRLAPEHPYPAALDDTVFAFEWMSRNGPNGQEDAHQLFISGDSAGGNLALAALLKLRDLGKRLPDGVIPISPATDLLCTGDSMERNAHIDPLVSRLGVDHVYSSYLRGGGQPLDIYASPLYADLNDLPPLYFQVGEREILLDDSTRFVKKAKTYGVRADVDVFPNMFHSFQGLAPVLPEANDAIERIGEFVKSLQSTSV